MADIVTRLMTFAFSDWMLIVLVPVILLFTLSYGLGSGWWRHPLGIITMLTSMSVLGLVTLIAYATATGERIPEFWRVLILGAVTISYLLKSVYLHIARRDGRIAERQRKGGVPAPDQHHERVTP